MYPATILHGTHWVEFYENKAYEKVSLAFLIEYDEELALAGLPPYYVHRERRKNDKLKNQRTVSELPISEPRRAVTTRSYYNDTYSTDVVIAETFAEVLKYLGDLARCFDERGYVDDMLRFREERKRVERDTHIAREDEMRDSDASEDGAQQYLF